MSLELRLLVQTRNIVDIIIKDVFPKNLKISITNDQSELTENQVIDLVNSIIFGIILVVTVLLFFLGFKNALFVGFAIPMSMFMSLFILDTLGFTLNTMILFGLIMGLGMLVDNGIVVVENVYRLMEKEGLNRIEATKKGIWRNCISYYYIYGNYGSCIYTFRDYGLEELESLWSFFQ